MEADRRGVVGRERREVIKDFKDLIVWQRGMELVFEVYKVTALLPKEETFGLRSQMRRCAVSIPSNIAEGKKRASAADYRQFLRVADGSAAELETQMLICRKLFEMDLSKAEGLLQEVQKMLGTMLAKLGKNKGFERQKSPAFARGSSFV